MSCELVVYIPHGIQPQICYAFIDLLKLNLEVGPPYFGEVSLTPAMELHCVY